LAILFGNIFTQLLVNFCEKIIGFWLCCRRFSTTEINFISENFKSVNQKLNTFVFRPVTTENILVVSPWRVKFKGRIVRFERSVVGLKDIEFAKEKQTCVTVKNVWYPKAAKIKEAH
jgi:hypothetical protein